MKTCVSGSGDHWGHLGRGLPHHFSLRFDQFSDKTLYRPALLFSPVIPWPGCWVVGRLAAANLPVSCGEGGSCGINVLAAGNGSHTAGLFSKEARDEATPRHIFRLQLTSTKNSEKGENKRWGMGKRSKLGSRAFFSETQLLDTFTFPFGACQDCGTETWPAEGRLLRARDCQLTSSE